MTQSRFLEAPLVRQADGELKNVRLFGVMTKTSVPSDKNVPLWSSPKSIFQKSSADQKGERIT